MLTVINAVKNECKETLDEISGFSEGSDYAILVFARPEQGVEYCEQGFING